MLKEQKVMFTDIGSFSDAEVDYPDIANHVCREVLGRPKHSVGILIGKNGNEMCIAANRHKEIRAVVCWNIESAIITRRELHANVLCLPGELMKDDLAEAILQTWFTTQPSEGELHKIRLQKLDA